MEEALKKGDDTIDPLSFRHNDLINKAFTKAKAKAWSSIQDHPEIIRLVQEAKNQKIDNNEASRKSGESFRNQAYDLIQIKNK